MYKRKNGTKYQEIESSYNLSIGDMMASILIIFILLFVSRTIDSNEDNMKREKIIDVVTSTKSTIISKLTDEFGEQDITINIDTSTGRIRIDEKLLFNSNESVLKEEGKEYLKKFIPIYVKIFLGNDEIKNELQQIVIEGHTDDVGSYMYNMVLSQKRSFEVLKYIYSEMGEFTHKDEFKNYVTTNGKSNTDLIRDDEGNVERTKSRRVEIQFKLKEEEALKKIRDTLEGK